MNEKLIIEIKNIIKCIVLCLLHRSQGIKSKITSKEYARINKIDETIKEINGNENLFIFIFLIKIYINI
mgnify:FL=1|tara:strand:- start:460 stop:666 length:207 start_codon:yes stop_codon:yes gene_type:complete